MDHLPLIDCVQLLRNTETRLQAAASDVSSIRLVIENLHSKVEGLKRELHEERQRRLAKPLRPGSHRQRKVFAKIVDKAVKEAKDGQDASE
jgi:hypothetical protein